MAIKDPSAGRKGGRDDEGSYLLILPDSSELRVRREIEDIDAAIDYACSRRLTYQWTVFFVGGVMFFASAMEITQIVFLFSCLKSYWSLSEASANSIGSCIFFGELIGSLLSGPLSDEIGRKPTSYIAITLMAFGGLLSAFAENLPSFLLFRTITGIGIGAR